MGIEQRRNPRRVVEGRIDVYDTIAECSAGILGDVSSGGMLLIASSPLPDDALFQFRFSLPGEDNDRRTVDVGAHLLWQDHASAPGRAWAGFRFIAMPEEHAHRIHGWIEAPGGPCE